MERQLHLDRHHSIGHFNSKMSASLAPECDNVKKSYDECFLRWYSEKYLRGTAKTDECEHLFKQYKSCLSVGS